MSFPVRGVIGLMVFGLALSLGMPDFNGPTLANAKEKEKEKEKAKEKEKKSGDDKKEHSTKKEKEKEKEAEKADANDLSMEIDVLSALRRLNPTPGSIEVSAPRSAKDTAQSHTKAQAGQSHRQDSPRDGQTRRCLCP